MMFRFLRQSILTIRKRMNFTLSLSPTKLKCYLLILLSVFVAKLPQRVIHWNMAPFSNVISTLLNHCPVTLWLTTALLAALPLQLNLLSPDYKKKLFVDFMFMSTLGIKSNMISKPRAVVLKAYHRSSDHRRGRHHRGHTFDDDDDVDDDEDNCPLHVQLQFACVNGEVDGAKKCAFVMDAIEVAFDKPSVRMHALVDQETYCSAKQQAREDYFNKLGNQSDSKQALFKEETHHFDEAYINEQKERHMLNLISTLNSHPQQQQQQQQQQGLVEIVPPTFHYPSTANNVVEPSNSQSSSSNCSPPPLQTTSPYTTPPQTPSTATTAVNTPNIMTAVVDTPKKSMPTMLFVPTNVMAKQQQQQQKKLLQRQQSLPQPGLSSSSSTSSSSSYSNHSVHTSSSAPVGPNPLFHIPHPPMPPTNTGTAHTPLSPTATTSSPFSNSCSSSKSSHSSLGHYRLAHLDELSIHQIQKECEVMLNMLKMKEEKFRNTFAEQQTDIYRGRNETVEERFLRKSCQKRLSDLEEDIVKLYNENEVLGNKLHKLEEEERIRREKNDELMNNKCRVCFTRNIEYCLVPCGHYAYCERCVMKLTECAICRHSIDRLQKLYTC
ncbi:hypothetical protein BDF20DRAFT_407339 [Mycotypha africana]|uniref:uncharacterized protein n=1 Tax=Mycotypha africana TaxID=64632 RepID=UPI0023015F32|nr:uncharacterized protein BDF20DRAFT_407339 [Mycotypha africana]KAI8984755.1 hypothetical protein BDF20DRAFT_407339 [Mycotypha africana]